MAVQTRVPTVGRFLLFNAGKLIIRSSNLGAEAGCAAAFYYSDETQVQVACQAENVRFVTLVTSILII